MCKSESLDQHEQRALCHFKFFVYRDFREARHLGKIGPTASYPESSPVYEACKALMGGGHERSKLEFARLYSDVLGAAHPDDIERPFLTLMGGLTLQALPDLFAEVQSGQIGGGPWIKICKETLRLRDAILAGSATAEIVDGLRSIPHNRGWPATREFDELAKHLLRLGLEDPRPCCISEH